MLRAIRFAARFESSIEDETAEAIRELSCELAGVSRERIGEEIRKMMQHPNRGVAGWELQYLGLDQIIFSEASCLNPVTRLGWLPENATYPTSLAAWIIDRHSNKANVHDVASNWRKSLLLSNQTWNELNEILTVHQQFFSCKFCLLHLNLMHIRVQLYGYPYPGIQVVTTLLVERATTISHYCCWSCP